MPEQSHPRLCECGHPLADHAWSGWGENTVCVEKLDDDTAGFYGVCPCVRREERSESLAEF